MTGEPKTLTLTTRHARAPVTYEQDENGAIHGITFHLPPGATWAGPDGVPVVARDEAAELRAALDVARDAMVSALVYHHHSLGNPVKEELNAAVNRAGRALAGGEEQE